MYSKQIHWNIGEIKLSGTESVWLGYILKEGVGFVHNFIAVCEDKMIRLIYDADKFSMTKAKKDFEEKAVEVFNGRRTSKSD